MWNSNETMSSKKQSSRDEALSDDIKNFVLVSGIPEVEGDVTDKLEIFFGKRINGGGDIEEITLMDKNEALIRFSKEKVAKSVVEKSPHLFCDYEVIVTQFEGTASETTVLKRPSTPASFSPSKSFVGENEDCVNIFETVNVVILTDQHPYILDDISYLQRISKELNITLIITKTGKVIKLEGEWNAINECRLQLNRRYSGDISQQLRTPSAGELGLPESPKLRTSSDEKPGSEWLSHRNRRRNGSNNDLDFRQNYSTESRGRAIKDENSERPVSRKAAAVEISDEDFVSGKENLKVISDALPKTKFTSKTINYDEKECTFQQDKDKNSSTSYLSSEGKKSVYGNSMDIFKDDMNSNSASTYSAPSHANYTASGESNLPGSEIWGAESEQYNTSNYSAQSHHQQGSASPTYAQKASSTSTYPQEKAPYLHQASSNPHQISSYPQGTTTYPYQTSQQTTSYPLQTASYPHQSTSYTQPTATYSHQTTSYTQPTATYSHQTTSYMQPTATSSHQSTSYTQPTATYSSPHTFNINGLKITVKSGDITQERVHTIVSSIETDLFMAGGLAKAVVGAGGYKIKEECEQWHQKNRITKNKIFTVSKGNLPCQRVMFVVMPECDRWKSSKTKIDEMTMFCKGVLKNLNETGAKSAAIPGLGTGAFYYPPEAFIDGMMNALRELQYRPSRTLNEITFIDRNMFLVQNLTKALINFK